jgi:hypothetical protein
LEGVGGGGGGGGGGVGGGGGGVFNRNNLSMAWGNIYEEKVGNYLRGNTVAYFKVRYHYSPEETEETLRLISAFDMADNTTGYLLLQVNPQTKSKYPSLHLYKCYMDCDLTVVRRTRD